MVHLKTPPEYKHHSRERRVKAKSVGVLVLSIQVMGHSGHRAIDTTEIISTIFGVYNDIKYIANYVKQKTIDKTQFLLN
ncbi:MAG TPA: hypothetical protein VIM16_00320 [Mucilaginibacter sp.]